MFVIPAIDILNGKCVRLVKGDFDKVTCYGDDPVEIAKRFEAGGAEVLHVVDLDGAKAGRPVNQRLILEVAKTVNVPVQAGGGIRNYEAARRYLENGVSRIILGTAAIKNPRLIRRLIDEFGTDRVAVAVDIKDDRLAIDGWTKSGGKSVAEGIVLLKRLGIRHVIVTDVSR